MVKKRSIYQLIFGTLLIMSSNLVIHAQGRIAKDTIFTIDDSFETTAKFSAKDSLYNDFRKKQLHLFGEAKVEYEDINLTADYILVDFEKKEIFASYTYGKDSVRVGQPKLIQDGEEINAAKIRLNYETKKAYIQEVKIKQDENYLYMGVAKRQSNEQIHFKQGKFTTCDLEEPHYHFQLSRAVLVPEKRIVSGPMNLWIKGVPTPLGLPFMFIPQKKPNERTHGILFPKFVPQSSYGMGLQDLGYYIPINDSLHTTFLANIYSRGSWGITNRTEYMIKYKFQGSFEAGFQQFKRPFPDKSRNNKLTLIWNHRQDPKANPLWNFSSSVNFISDNQSKNNLDPLNKVYFNNSFNSDINLMRYFPGKPISTGLKASIRQNSQTHNFTVTAPVFNANVTRFFPFKPLRKNPVGPTKWYEQIGMTYNVEAQNSATFHDSLIRQNNYAEIKKKFMNGVSQSTTIQTTVSLFDNTWKLTPSVNYSNRINFQQIRKSEVNNVVVVDTLRKPGMSQNVSFNAQLTTVLYSYYRFVGKNKPLVRHILTPSFGYRFVPNLNKSLSYATAPDTIIKYSAFEQSLYRESVTSDQSIITFGFNNTFEMKRKSAKDTLTGYKKTRLIDALSFSGSYDLLRDSMKLSNIGADLRISPVEFFNFVASGSFSPYAWNDSTGRSLKEYAVKQSGKLGRFVQMSFNSSFTLAPKASRSKIQENKEQFAQNWNADFQYFALHPEAYVDFAIPWKVSLSHIYSINANQNKTNSTEGRKNYFQTQTLALNGDFSFTKRWKVVTEVYFDLKIKQITNARLNFTRNMHCWNLAFYWTPIGTNKSFLFSLNSTSNLFKDAKLDLRKPPELF